MDRSTATSSPVALERPPAGSQLETPAYEGPVADFDVLGVYFRDLGRVELMSREDELAAARDIAALRLRLWRTLLGYPPVLGSICELARTLLPRATCPTAALDAAMRTGATLRARELQSHQRAHDEACERLAAALAEADVDGVVSERVLADLTGLEVGGREDQGVRVKAPRRASQPFLGYVAAARASHRALWSAKDRFVRANLRLVVTIARRFNHGRMPLHDLIQEGNIGLMKAVDRFDPRRGFRFSTYGSWWIRHAISRALATTGRAVRLPVHMIEAQHKLARVRREFAAKHGREPGDDELAAVSGISVERIARMRWSLVEDPVSLDQPIGRESGLTLQDALADGAADPAPEQLHGEQLRTQLEEAFAALPVMEAEILRKRLGLDDAPEQTLKEIGECYALSRERIRQIQEQALGRLRRELKRRDLM